VYASEDVPTCKEITEEGATNTQVRLLYEFFPNFRQKWVQLIFRSGKYRTAFMALRLKQMELSAKTEYGPLLKITQHSAHAQNHVSIERCRKSFTTIFLSDHDFPLTASNFGNLI